jgi:tetratricopeptide (TPR) repeat protein
MSGALVALVLACAAARPLELSELTRQLGEAEKHYNLGQARTLVEVQRPTVDRSTPMPHVQVYAASLLLRAHLAEYALPETPLSNGAQREALQREALDAAQECLEHLAPLPETPEVVRMRADCYAVLAHAGALEDLARQHWAAAVARTLAMDKSNPRAHIAAARHALHLQDAAKALEHAEQALLLNPVLENAIMLRAQALDLGGRTAEALAAWQQLLAQNPAASPAAFRLKQAAGVQVTTQPG